jgi:hypothetical protein
VTRAAKKKRDNMPPAIPKAAAESKRADWGASRSCHSPPIRFVGPMQAVRRQSRNAGEGPGAGGDQQEQTDAEAAGGRG